MESKSQYLQTKIGTVPWGVCEYPEPPVIGKQMTIIDGSGKRHDVVIREVGLTYVKCDRF